VAVTGATGAVGSVAVEILTRLGFQVSAISGKTEQAVVDTLTELGAHEILGREVLEESPKPLLKPRFDHGIDTVGGAPLVALLKQIKPDGSVACCGLAAGPQLPNATVLPFILRGVQLLGVDSVEIPRSVKTTVWQKLAHEWACPVTESKVREIGRHQLGDTLGLFLQGKSSGKIVLDHALTET
jgi:putative YhdH/YhfP family quinone oxidoreductase